MTTLPTPQLLGALHSPRRREILRLCWDGPTTAGAVHEALPDVTFGAVSQHLRVLREAGLVTPSEPTVSAARMQSAIATGQNCSSNSAARPDSNLRNTCRWLVIRYSALR